jgi:MFS family permease
MVETKARSTSRRQEVQAKAAAAARWCQHASAYAASVGGVEILVVNESRRLADYLLWSSRRTTSPLTPKNHRRRGSWAKNRWRPKPLRNPRSPPCCGSARSSSSGWRGSAPPALLLLVALGGAARTFEVPATQALLSAVVPPLLLPRAVAISSSAMQAATLIGPVVAGLLYLLGATEAYGVTALLYVAAAAMMAAVRPLVHQDRSGPQSNFLASFMEGIRFLRRQPMLLGAISLDMFAVLLGGATALLPIIADQLLQTGPVGLGLLRAAPAVGALAMSFWLASHPLHAAGRALFIGVALFGLATLALGLSRSLPLSLAILLLLGAADMVSVVIRQTLVQLHTPDEMRGRVSSVNAIFIGASNQLGEFESGLTAQWFGLVPSILLGGSGTLLVVGLWMRWFPQLLQVRSLEEAMPAQNRP